MKKNGVHPLKVLLSVLALTMLLCMPASAASKKTVATIGKKSYTSLSSAVKAVKDGQTIKLKSDTTINSALNRNKKYTIDLNGHTLNGTYRIKDSRIGVGNGTAVRISSGRVSIKNGIVSGLYVNSGVTLTLSKMIEPNLGAQYGFIYIKKGANVKIKSGTIEMYGIYNKGTLTIKNAIITSPSTMRFTNETSGVVMINGAIFKHSNIYNEGKMTISAGKFTGESYSSLISNSGDKSQLTIKEGTFKSSDYNCVINNSYYGSLKITGGAFKATGNVENVDNKITGTIKCGSGSKTSITGGTISNKHSNGIYVSSDVDSFKCSGAKITVSSSKMEKIRYE